MYDYDLKVKVCEELRTSEKTIEELSELYKISKITLKTWKSKIDKGEPISYKKQYSNETELKAKQLLIDFKADKVFEIIGKQIPLFTLKAWKRKIKKEILKTKSIKQSDN